jgi:hypothetical protein
LYKPDETATAAAPFSRAATRLSKTSVVGFPILNVDQNIRQEKINFLLLCFT